MVTTSNPGEIAVGKKIKWIVFGVMVLVFLVIILRFPLNKFEWMLTLDADTGVTAEGWTYDDSASWAMNTVRC